VKENKSGCLGRLRLSSILQGNMNKRGAGRLTEDSIIKKNEVENSHRRLSLNLHEKWAL